MRLSSAAGHPQIQFPRLVALTLLACFALFYLSVIFRGGGQPGVDFDRVWLAALRLRAGGPLYVNVGNEQQFYTWAPWLAWICLPLTSLPKPAVETGWIIGCGLGWAATLWPIRRNVGALLLIGPLTFLGVWWGNVQPIMTAVLVAGIGRRWGPLAVGTAASLKVSPILLVIPWLMSRQWGKVAAALAVAVLLGAPALFVGIEHYPFAQEPSLSLRGVSPVLFVLVAAAAIGLAISLSNTRYRWVSAALAVIASRPSLVHYDVGYLLVGIPPDPARRGQQVAVQPVGDGEEPGSHRAGRLSPPTSSS
jgi:hypothetical protein